jgi:thymidylate synthase (FAD)
MKIKEISPLIWNFKVVGGQDAWREVAYSARMSGVPESIPGEQIFTMILENDYSSALEHVIIKFDLKMSKGNAPELLEHRMASHSGFSTRYIAASKGMIQGQSGQKDLLLGFKQEDELHEVIVPWHLLSGRPELEKEKERLFEAIEESIMSYESMLSRGIPRELARYALPFCQAVGIYHFTMNLRSLLNFLSLRLCVRASVEMRCLAAQLYFALEKELPILKGMVGCRGFTRGVCPESGVTGVRVGKPLTYYPVCPFRAEGSKTYIPTQKEFLKNGRVGGFDPDAAQKIKEAIYWQWTEWGGIAG